MGAAENAAVMLEIFRSIETRDTTRFAELCDPELELHWPPALPYGGISRGDDARERGGWGETWMPLQPSDAEKKMDPRVVAANGDEVVILWHQRGVNPDGERLDSPVLALYSLRNGKLVRGQMFYFDTERVVEFLGKAASRTGHVTV